jgi:hypothetical protein
MVSAIIVIIGILKPFLFNKIKCKQARKSALAFTNVFLSFCATAIYFLIRDINWELYWLASLITSVACIITYWLYENTCLRNAIQKLITLAIDKFAKIAKMAVYNAEAKAIEAEVKKAFAELKTTAKNEIKTTAKKSVKNNKDLENL